MSKLTEYIETYPFPPITLETITKAINNGYGANFTESEIENIIYKYFIIHFEDFNKTNRGIRDELLFYKFVNLNEPCCNSTGDCNTCTSYSLCKQAPEFYQPSLKENEEV